MNISPVHRRRIKQELREVGVTPYGLLKSEARRLPAHIASDEHIHGCIYGKHANGSAMLVATNKRLVFIDVKPFGAHLEEVAYNQIMDLGVGWRSYHSRVHVSTRERQFSFRFVNSTCARVFVHYLESRVAGLGGNSWQVGSPYKKGQTLHDQKYFASEDKSFVLNHHLCTISTLGADGYPYGATMFYFVDPSAPETIRLITKSETTTARNIALSSRVALTITDEPLLTTMHIYGDAEREQNVTEGYKIIQNIISNNGLVGSGVLPPVAQIKKGSYVVLKIGIKGSQLVVYNSHSATKP